MHTFILQDWTTIRSAGATVVQSESQWLDLTPYQDVVFWIDTREQSGTPTLILQTSPTRDDFFFVNMIAPLGLSPILATPNVKPAIMNQYPSPTLIPLARYVRWTMIGGTPPWDATFRIICAANSPGT